MSQARTHYPLRIIAPNEISSLLFGQQNIWTHAFFLHRHGQGHSISLKDFPHYQFLESCMDSPYEDHEYMQYLRASWDFYWPEDNTEARRRKKIHDFLTLYKDIRSRRHLCEDAIREPIEVCRRPDGQTVLLRGNHRAAIARTLDLDLKALQVPFETAIEQFVQIPDEYYGSQRMDRPYQSIHYHEREILAGRRRDMLERMGHVFPHDIKGRTVLDLGSNLGQNCRLALWNGARRVVGVESSKKIVSAACLLESLLVTSCVYRLHDLGSPIEDLEPHDTVFCFALWIHVKNREELCRNIKRLTKRVLYFEGHPDTRLESYKDLLNPQHFSSIELLVYLPDGVHTTARTRPLYRCEV